MRKSDAAALLQAALRGVVSRAGAGAAAAQPLPVACCPGLLPRYATSLAAFTRQAQAARRALAGGCHPPAAAAAAAVARPRPQSTAAAAAAVGNAAARHFHSPASAAAAAVGFVARPPWSLGRLPRPTAWHHHHPWPPHQLHPGRASYHTLLAAGRRVGSGGAPSGPGWIRAASLSLRHGGGGGGGGGRRLHGFRGRPCHPCYSSYGPGSGPVVWPAARLWGAIHRGHAAAKDTWHACGGTYLQSGARSLWEALLQSSASCASWPSWASTRLVTRLPGVARQPAVLQVPWAWLPSREWFLRPSFDSRVAILSALFSHGGAVMQRLAPLLLAHALRKDSYLAACFMEAGPPSDAMQLLHQRAPRPPRTWLQELAFALSSCLRLLLLAMLFAPVALTAPWALLLPGAEDEGPHGGPQGSVGSARRRGWYRSLRQALQRAGPAFIKWGQWAATRRDLFPRDMCEELQLLQTQAPSHDFSHTRAAIVSSLGCQPSVLFDHLDEQPLASGSIGQIHAAVLSERGAQYTGCRPGRQVAIKVRHPGVTQAIERDFLLMSWVAHVASLIPGLRDLRLEDSLRQFAAPLREQVDFTLEALHLWQFSYNFRSSPDVHFPLPIWASPAVLVETLEPGRLVSDYVSLGSQGDYSEQLAKLGCSTFLQMLLRDNLIHADLHPGNILVRLAPPRDPIRRTAYEALIRTGKAESVPSSWMTPHFVLLDVGMVNRLTPEDQANMLGLFKGLVALDGKQIGKYTLAFAGEEQQCPDPDAFVSDCHQHFGELASASSWEDTRWRHGGEAMASALEYVRRHKVTLPGHVCAVLITTLVLEGWSSALDPEHSVLEQVDELLGEHRSSWSAKLLGSLWPGSNGGSKSSSTTQLVAA